jgi:uncharacterized protein with von Willebrand factor type A (vWA) domain
MKHDFQSMTKAQLRAYVLKHRDDREAFQALADQIYSNPDPQWYQPEDAERVVELIQSAAKHKNESS